MKKEVATFIINGKTYDAIIEPHMLLVDVIRDKIGLTGTKYACGTGDCGACTVLIDDKLALSCLTLAITARDRNITTIEGVNQGGSLHHIQKAFLAHGAVQCGYCTPGMVLSAIALLNKKTAPTRDEIKEALAGNLCRCTGYVKIIDAVEEVAQAMKKGGK